MNGIGSTIRAPGSGASASRPTRAPSAGRACTGSIRGCPPSRCRAGRSRARPRGAPRARVDLARQRQAVVGGRSRWPRVVRSFASTTWARDFIVAMYISRARSRARSSSRVRTRSAEYSTPISRAKTFNWSLRDAASGSSERSRSTVSCPPRSRSFLCLPRTWLGEGAHVLTSLERAGIGRPGVPLAAPGGRRCGSPFSSGRGWDPPCSGASVRPGAHRGPQDVPRWSRPRAPRRPGSRRPRRAGVVEGRRVADPGVRHQALDRRRASIISSSGGEIRIASPRDVTGSSDARISESRSTSERSSSVPRDASSAPRISARPGAAVEAARGTRARPCTRRARADVLQRHGVDPLEVGRLADAVDPAVASVALGHGGDATPCRSSRPRRAPRTGSRRRRRTGGTRSGGG